MRNLHTAGDYMLPNITVPVEEETESLGLWEQIHNPNFKPIEFDRFKEEAGDNAFTLTPQQWIKALKQNLIEDTGNRE